MRRTINSTYFSIQQERQNAEKDNTKPMDHHCFSIEYPQRKTKSDVNSRHKQRLNNHVQKNSLLEMCFLIHESNSEFIYSNLNFRFYFLSHLSNQPANSRCHKIPF